MFSLDVKEMVGPLVFTRLLYNILFLQEHNRLSTLSKHILCKTRVRRFNETSFCEVLDSFQQQKIHLGKSTYIHKRKETTMMPILDFHEIWLISTGYISIFELEFGLFYKISEKKYIRFIITSSENENHNSSKWCS